MSASGEPSLSLSVQQVLSLAVRGAVPALHHFTEMWYWVFLWCLFSLLVVHGTMGLLMFITLQQHRHGRLITLLLLSVGLLSSLSGALITSEYHSPPMSEACGTPLCPEVVDTQQWADI
ncbi:transmembrane protein 170B [Arapaima gigas]